MSGTGQGKRAIAAAKGKAANGLLGMLDSLDKTNTEVLQQWQSESDFSKVDVVVAEFIKRRQYVDALRYMEKVGTLVQTICSKLRVKAGLGPENNNSMNLDQGDDPASSPSIATSMGATPLGRAGKRPSSRSVPGAPQPEYAQHELLLSERQNLQDRLKEAVAALEHERRDHRARESSHKAAQERAQERTAESVAAAARANVAERRCAELAERVDALSELLRAAERKGKRESQRAAGYRERLTRPGSSLERAAGPLGVTKSLDAGLGHSASQASLGAAHSRAADARAADVGGGGGAPGRVALLKVIKEKEDEIHTIKASLAKYKYLVATSQKRALASEAELAAIKNESIPEPPEEEPSATSPGPAEPSSEQKQQRSAKRQGKAARAADDVYGHGLQPSLSSGKESKVPLVFGRPAPGYRAAKNRPSRFRFAAGDDAEEEAEAEAAAADAPGGAAEAAPAADGQTDGQAGGQSEGQAPPDGPAAGEGSAAESGAGAAADALGAAAGEEGGAPPAEEGAAADAPPAAEAPPAETEAAA